MGKVSIGVWARKEADCYELPLTEFSSPKKKKKNLQKRKRDLEGGRRGNRRMKGGRQVLRNHWAPLHFLIN